jgi:hypothetical protein
MGPLARSTSLAGHVETELRVYWGLGPKPFPE